MTEKTPRWLNLLRYVWIPILVALIGVAGAIVVALLNNADETNPGTFAYQVQVQAKDTDEPIPNAEVTIQVSEVAPLHEITDTHGVARVLVDDSQAGQPGRLIVRVTGYTTHVESINVRKNVPPTVVRLEPAP